MIKFAGTSIDLTLAFVLIVNALMTTLIVIGTLITPTTGAQGVPLVIVDCWCAMNWLAVVIYVRMKIN